MAKEYEEISVDREELSFAKKRNCRFYFSYMEKEIPEFAISKEAKSLLGWGLDWAKDKIENELNRRFHDIYSYNSFVRKMKSAYIRTIIPDDNFSWLQDEEACYFAWITLLTNRFHFIPSILAEFEPSNQAEMQLYVLNSMPINKEVKISQIISFFDEWDKEYEEKLACIQTLQNKWLKLRSTFVNPFKWVNTEQHDKCERVYKTLMARINMKRFPSHPTYTHLRQLIPFMNAIFYAWDAHEDTKRLVLDKMRQANRQNNYRDSIIGKKVINTYVKKEIKEMLDTLAKDNNRKINEELEALIFNAWNKRQTDV
ncbi:hypothetical protein CBW54_00670 [Yersinia kristensenii]|nr:hypothetical protein CBW54_00670 [Yersinia kristensenii]